jgi:hypothetical protein
MTSQNEEGRITDQVSGASKMSLLGGLDRTEDSKSEDIVQAMPSPRSWSTATGKTSKDAARKARNVSSALCREILNHIHENGPTSPEDLCKALSPLGFSRLVNTYRARTSDLAHAGLLRDSGDRGVSEAGSKVIKWTLASGGAE